MKHYYLGLAAGYSAKQILKHTFAIGCERDRGALQRYLTQRYKGETILAKNGRSALTLALKAYFEPGDGIILNGFTCYAVYEAVKEAQLVPIWADINKDSLNFDKDTLEQAISAATSVAGSTTNIKGIVVQNSLGNPVDIAKIEKIAKKHNLMIVEDMAHCVGAKYPDGREVGTVGVAAALSFGKDKAIDAISGGAVVLRDPLKSPIKAPNKLPKISDTLRARFYPIFGAVARGLSYIHLGGIWMRALVKIHWVEKSADNKLDITRKIAKFEAKMALGQLKNISDIKSPLRKYYLVRDRGKVLGELRKNGYYFDGLWYEKPVSPIRYYKKVHFPEDRCPVATKVAQEIVNLPTYYTEQSLAEAKKIIGKNKEEQ